METIEGASVLLVDDRSELLYLYESVYPVLSHSLERNPEANLLSYRWQNYTKSHHRLPITVASGADIPLDSCNKTLDFLSRSLRVPIIRMATIDSFASVTDKWELNLRSAKTIAAKADLITQKLVNVTKRKTSTISRKTLSSGPRVKRLDLPHFCSHMANKSAVDTLISHFESFCIAGQPSSIPYIASRLKELGKPFTTIPSHSSEIVKHIDHSFDCMLICGSFGDFESDRAVVALQHVGAAWRTKNIGTLEDRLAVLNITPPSANDWFHPFTLGEHTDRLLWQTARIAIANEL